VLALYTIGHIKPVNVAMIHDAAVMDCAIVMWPSSFLASMITNKILLQLLHNL